VKAFPETTVVMPTFGHFAPALTAANAGRESEDPRNVIATSAASVLFMSKRVLT
jgi:hypothetical protein